MQLKVVLLSLKDEEQQQAATRADKSPGHRILDLPQNVASLAVHSLNGSLRILIEGENTMDILVINGGMPKGGRTELLTQFIAKEYRLPYINISEIQLPLLTGEQEQWQLPAVISFKKKVKAADGLILISPEYHGGMSGALKNTLDYLTREELNHKPVALLATAGGGKGGINCLNNMRTVMRGFYANVIPKQIILDPDCFDYEDGTLLEESRDLVTKLVDELNMYVKMSHTLIVPRE
ncbi:azobenzene reductase [Lederbergia galactosidilyticus]|nr:azobenzene reductase [Lederbergia galactosidilytica]